MTLSLMFVFVAGLLTGVAVMLPGLARANRAGETSGYEAARREQAEKERVVRERHYRRQAPEAWTRILHRTPDGQHTHHGNGRSGR